MRDKYGFERALLHCLDDLIQNVERRSLAALEKSDITFNRGLLDGGAAAEANRGQRVGGVHEEPDVLLAKSPQTHRASTSAADGRPARGWLAKLRNKWPHLPQRRRSARRSAVHACPLL